MTINSHWNVNHNTGNAGSVWKHGPYFEGNSWNSWEILWHSVYSNHWELGYLEVSASLFHKQNISHSFVVLSTKLYLHFLSFFEGKLSKKINFCKGILL